MSSGSSTPERRHCARRNRFPGDWDDIEYPVDASPGKLSGALRLKAGEKRGMLPIREDSVQTDDSSYSSIHESSDINKDSSLVESDFSGTSHHADVSDFCSETSGSQRLDSTENTEDGQYEVSENSSEAASMLCW